MNTARPKNQRKRLLISVTAAIAMMAVLVLMVSGPAAAQDDGTASQPAWTAGQIAANGPIPGDVTQYWSEMECIKGIETPGYFQSFNGAELTDSERSGIWPCATFTGSFTGSNTVYAYRFPESYINAAYVNNRLPGEMYIVGGGNPPLTGTMPAGPYMSKVNATTGVEEWRTYFDNGNVSGNWIAATNLNILPDGNIIHGWGDNVALVDGRTGMILKTNNLPTGDADPDGVNFKHVTIAPDGTVIMKDQTRPYGSDMQGTTAIIVGNMEGLTQPNAVLVAVDPKTLEVLDSIDLPQPSTTPHIITTYNDQIAIYVAMDSLIQRYFWDADSKTLSQDETWESSPTVEGQTTPDAPTVLGDWIVLQTNGLGSSTVASSIVVVNQNDSSNTQTIYPFGDLPDGGFSLAPPKPGADPDNNMIYSADMGIGKVAGISIDPDTGDMETVFVLDNNTSTFQMLIGPPDQRVLILSNNVTDDAGNQTEQVTWRNAATGELYAASDFFEPLTSNSVIPPGFGGRFYFPTGLGVISLQVMPTPADSADSASADTASTETEPAVSAQYYTDTLEVRYCELVLNYDDRAEIYNSTGLTDCPDDQWDNLDVDSIAQTYGANSVDKNGPQYWMTDNLTLYGSEPFDLGGIMMRFGATLPPPTPGGSSDPPPYSVFSPTKTQYNEYNAGSTVYQLVDPDGNVYVLQARKNTVSADSLATLGDQLSLPDGWEYRAVVLDADLEFNMTSDMAIPSTADDFGQIYVQILE